MLPCHVSIRPVAVHVTLPAVDPHTLAFPYNVSGGLLFGKHRVSQ